MEIPNFTKKASKEEYFNKEEENKMIELLNNLLSLSTENEVVEFKEAKNQFDKNKLGQYFSALCNEANLLEQNIGYLLFGIDNNKNIVGTHITEQ